MSFAVKGQANKAEGRKSFQGRELCVEGTKGKVSRGIWRTERKQEDYRGELVGHRPYRVLNARPQS